MNQNIINMKTNKRTSEFSTVPETILIAIRARNKEVNEPGEIINNPRSIEILNQIDYDFSSKKGVLLISQKGVGIKAEIIDELTWDFVHRNPNCIMANGGCELDTRYSRLQTEKMNWHDLDVPESLELEKHFFHKNERFHFISKLTFDFS